jgi:predicted nucleic-acid-binding protein
MIGLDTNILVRYFTQDDPVQSAKATDVLERQLTHEGPGFISIVTMDRAYRLTKDRIITVLERLMRADTLVIENEPEVFVAMVALRDGNGEFGDALIAALSARAGCTRVLTFDRRALRLPGFELA